jgi:hypothetical protein
MTDSTEIAGDVLAYITASIGATVDGKVDALAVADAALNAHPSQQVWTQFTALILLVAVAEPMTFDELRAFLAMLGLCQRRHAVGL